MKSFAISVIIPLYNAEKFIGKALESCLQFSEVKEIIVVDDGFKDEAKSIVAEYARNHPQIKLFEHPNNENRGAGATRNLGLEKATQEFIAFLDADDYYLPNRFEFEKQLFENPEVDGIYGATGVHFYNETGRENFIHKFKIQNPEEADEHLTTLQKEVDPKMLFKHLWAINVPFIGHFHLNALTVRKTVIDQYNLRFNEKLRLHQDTEFMGRLAYLSDLFPGNIQNAIAIRGVHDENRYVSNERDTKKINQNKKLQYSEAGKWLKNQNAEEEVIKYFDKITDYFDFKLSGSWNRKIKYLKFISKYEGFLKSDEFPVDHIHRNLFKNYPLQKFYLEALFLYRKLF